MNRPRVHILYEHGADQQPFGSAHVRLLRPWTHPALAEKFTVTFGLEYDGQPVEAVVVDRLWRPDISVALAEELLARVRRAGGRLIYALDDNFFTLAEESKDWTPSTDQLGALEYFLRNADGVVVTTPGLAEYLAGYNSKIYHVPNAIDERLVPAPVDAAKKRQGRFAGWFGKFLHPRSHAPGRKTVIGYMGTYTHDDDLLMVLPALQAVCRQHSGEVELQLIGVAFRQDTVDAMAGMPVKRIAPPDGSADYPDFISWFARNVAWDMAIAPLCDNRFNRCKSDIKFLDYCAVGLAGIYSRVPAYQASVAHGVTGLLVDNEPEAWRDALDSLVNSPDLRSRLAGQAARYLHSERTVGCTANVWIEAMNHIISSGT